LRINRGITEALGPQGVLNGLMQADRFGLLKQIGFTWDALNSQWNQWVVGFNQDRQRYALESLLGMRDMDWRQLAMWLIAGVLSTSGLVGGLLLLKVYRRRKEPVAAAYDRFCAKLANAGITRALHEGPMDFLSRIVHERPAIAASARSVVEAYVALRYSPPARTPDVQAFVVLVRRFRIV
jgi:hypothetical protein